MMGGTLFADIRETELVQCSESCADVGFVIHKLQYRADEIFCKPCGEERMGAGGGGRVPDTAIALVGSTRKSF